MKAVVSDATALIVLFNIGRIDLMHNLFEKVYIPEAVRREINKAADVLPKWIEIRTVEESLTKLWRKSLDKGESEAIVLALQEKLPLIIDEKKGRKLAKRAGISVVGLLGIIGWNMKEGYITYEEACKVYYAAKEARFRVGVALESQFLEWLDAHR